MNRIGKIISVLILAVFALLTVAPLFFLFCGGMMGNGEINEYLKPFIYHMDGFVGWRLFPLYPTLRNYVRLLLDSPEFFRMFWNTMAVTAGILLGQFLFGLPAAWGLARYRAYDAAVPGNDAVGISGVKPARHAGYALVHHPAGGIFHFFGIFDVPFFLRDSRRAFRVCKN